VPRMIVLHTREAGIAKASHVEARDVVGYSGSRGPAALRAKLARLCREARGFTAELDVQVQGRPLRVYPVEWAIATAGKHAAPAGRQRTLFG